MSINVTVNGNPTCVYRKRMVLSDLDQIKKCERDRRRRLRLEQVRQQSKEISMRLLERAKQVEKQELSKLETDPNFVLKRKHDGKIAELQQKYREDMENIGQAHAAAALEPNVDIIIEAEWRRNRATAIERGKEAVQKAKDASKKEDPQTLKVERLKQVREVENVRSTMIASLPKPPSPSKGQQTEVSSQDEPINATIIHKRSPRKKKCIKRHATPKKGKPSDHRKQHTPKSQVCFNDNGKTAVTEKEIEEVLEEPRKVLPVKSPSKVDKVIRYNPDDYKQVTSESSTVSSTTSSDDSSYFSDGMTEVCRKKRTPKHHTSPASCTVEVYDHATRQKHTYDRPAGLVEKMNIRNEPNAEEMARDVVETECKESRLAEKWRQNAQRRGNDAILRERVRRDYQTFLHNLNLLSKDERILRSIQSGNTKENVHMRDTRRKECQEMKQRKMDRAFEEILTEKTPCPTPCPEEPVASIVTIPPVKKQRKVKEKVCSAWQDAPFASTAAQEAKCGPGEEEEVHKEEDDGILSRDEQLLEMLKKVERQKRLLLQEFGANLPSDVFNATMKPLFDEKPPEKTPVVVPCSGCGPEIRVINLSVDETDENRNKTKKKKKKEAAKIETAVQTSTLNVEAEDKSVQVEIPKPVDEERNSRVHPLEPNVIILTPENVDSSSSFASRSSVEGLTIDVGKEEVKVTPIKRRQPDSKKVKQPRAAPKSRSTPVSKTCSPSKRLSRSAPTTPRKDLAEKQINIQFGKKNLRVDVEKSSLESKPCEIQTRSRSTLMKRRVVKVRDSSDASTSFSSPPPIATGSLLPSPAPGNNTTPILELLDSSLNLDRVGTSRNNNNQRPISPVSTPETPSPRTMRIPSNIPHPEKIGRMLQFSSTDSSVLENSLPRSSCRTDKICIPGSPTCGLVQKFDRTDVRRCPAILEKYEELQTTCAEKIASLNDLIEKVRQEQKGLDFSVTLEDARTLRLASRCQPGAKKELECVRRLVENIETIHNQLAQTLQETQKIISNETDERGVREPVEGESRDLGAKPKVVSSEVVNISMSKFRKVPETKGQGLEPEGNWKGRKDDNDMVEKLSQEILEQSKSLEKSENDKIARDEGVAINRQLDQGEKEGQGTSKGKDKDFVPLLTGIPKVPKALPILNGRGRPPVTLTTAQYRPDLESPGHELSTIVEFDTPDTGNRSLASTRSPAGKSRRSLIPTPEKPKSKPKSLNTSLKTPPEDEDAAAAAAVATQRKSTEEKITSTSSHSFSGLSGISEICSSPTSELLKYASSSEEMETALKKMGLGWAVATLKKTREASALSSSSNSDVTPINAGRKMMSTPAKKQQQLESAILQDLSDVSSISIRDASKSTDRIVLLKGRTSTPNVQQHSNYSSDRSLGTSISTSTSTSTGTTTTTSTSGSSLQENSDIIMAPNFSLSKKSNKQTFAPQ